MPLPRHEEVGPEPALLRREQRAGAAEAGGDLVADQQHVVRAARGAERARGRPGRRAACRPRPARAARRSRPRARARAAATSAIAASKHRGSANVGRAQHREAQRVEDVGAEAAVADRERADRVAVVRAAEREERGAARRRPGSPSTGTRSSAPARPPTRRRTRRGSAGRRPARRAASASDELDHDAVAVAEHRGVRAEVELLAQRVVELGDVVAERVDPERRDRVEVATAVDVDELVALGALDDDRRVVRRTSPSA